MNGSWKFLRHSKFGRLTVFGTFKSFGGGFQVSHARKLKMSSKDSLGVMMLTETVSVTTTNRKTEYESLTFGRIRTLQNLHTTNQREQEM
jgi:hypothetical protein